LYVQETAAPPTAFAGSATDPVKAAARVKAIVGIVETARRDPTLPPPDAEDNKRLKGMR
jgi:hypothetical protein